MFIQANIGSILTIITALVTIFIMKDAKNIPIFYMIIAFYLDIWFFKIAFEYQRITLLISRIAKLNKSRFTIAELQILMTNNSFALLLFFSSFLTGIIIGYLLLKSIIFLVIFIFLKYILNFLIPTYIPYAKLFELVSEEINKNIIQNPIEYIEKLILKKYFEELPCTKDYENWAFKKYGKELLSIK